ncbi:hypothetical protein [Streptomyces sp. NPDC055036]
MITATTANLCVADGLGRRLRGQEVAQPSSGRFGTVGAVLIYTSKVTGRVVKKVARMHLIDDAGREWSADTSTLQPCRPIAPGLPAGTR